MRDETRQRTFSRSLFGLQIVLVAAAPTVAALLIPRNGWWVLGAALCAGGALVVAEARKRQADARRRDGEIAETAARTASRVAMVAALQPVAISLTGIVTSNKSERQQLLGTVTQAIVVAAVRQVSADGVRGGWFAHGHDEAGRRVLRRTCSDGRNDTTDHTEFVEGTTEGDAALRMVDTEGHLYVPDLQDEPPIGWDPDRIRRYRTFISVGLSAKDEALGMLTVDALEPGSLTDDDLQTVILLASMLRVGLASDLPPPTR